MARPATFDDPTVTARLARDLPRWSLAEGVIERTFRTAGWKATLMVATTIGHLAEVAWHHPELRLSYNGVTVRLSTHVPPGITDLDFALAAQIDAVVGWEPGAPFSGTPDDPRHAYMRREG